MREREREIYETIYTGADPGIMKGGAWRCVEQRPFKGVRGHAPLENFELYIQFPAI